MRWAMLLAVAIQSISLAQSAQTRPAGVSIEELPLGSTKGYDSVKAFAFGPDSRHLAFLGIKGEKQFIVRDGVESGPFEWVIPASLMLSPIEARVACILQEGNDMSVLVGGQVVGKGYYRVAEDHLRFSDDGKHFAYTAQIGDKGAVVVRDGVAGKMHPVASAPVFSPGGAHCAYVVTLASGKMCMVWDDQEQKPYDRVSLAIQFSSDGKRLAYTVMQDRKFIPIVDGKEISKPLDGTFLLLSPAGDHVAYVAGNDKQTYMMLDGKVGPSFDSIEVPPAFSLDGKHLAYIAIRQKQATLILDGVGQAPFDEIAAESLTFSADSTHFAYAAGKGNERFIVLDGKRQPSFDHIVRPGLLFSPDGKRLAYAAVRGQQCVAVCDGVEGPRYEQILAMAFSSDGKHFAYHAMASHQPLLVVDGKASVPYDAVTPVAFSPDGAHWIYAGLRDSVAKIVVDGVDLPQNYAAWVRDSRAAFDAAGAAHLLMSKDRDFLDVAVKIAGK